MKTQTDKFISAFEVTPTKDTVAAFAQNLQEIGEAAEEVKSHLSRYADAEDNVTLKRQAEALRTWIDLNSEGLAVAAHAAALGPVWAEEVKGRLEAAARDLRIIEQESSDIRRDPESVTDILQVWNDVNSVLESMEDLHRPSVMPVGVEKIVAPSQAFAR